MSNITISSFGNKIFLEILYEINLFPKFKFHFCKDLDLCFNDDEKEKKIIILFLNQKNKKFFNNERKTQFPVLLIMESPNTVHNISSKILDKLILPFKIGEFEKKITSLISRKEYLKNSLIELGDYIIDKNERKIKKNNVNLKLSEKEINFLFLFSQFKEPITKNFALERVWKYSVDSETHTVETHIHRLRKKILKKFNDDNFIKKNNNGYFV